MSPMVQLTVAGDVREAEEIQEILASAGITSELEPAVEHHPREVEDTPPKVLVPERAARGRQGGDRGADRARRARSRRLSRTAPARPTCCAGIGAVSARSASRRGTNSPIGWSVKGSIRGHPGGKVLARDGCL